MLTGQYINVPGPGQTHSSDSFNAEGILDNVLPTPFCCRRLRLLARPLHHVDVESHLHLKDDWTERWNVLRTETVRELLCTRSPVIKRVASVNEKC